MCTVSWSLEKGGYRLFFNRDEQLSRAPAEAPIEWTEATGAFYGPKDPVGGGTWIGVNSEGWTTAVLNFYDAAVEGVEQGAKSRGELVRSLAPLKEKKAVKAALSKLSMKDFAPFHLLRVSPAGEGSLWTSDGKKLRTGVVSPESLPITTSSFDTERVTERRKAIYSSLNAGGNSSADGLKMFHRYFDNSDPAASVSMRRDDAETVSLSEIHVKAKAITFDYFERAEEGTGFKSPVSLKIQRAK